MALTLRTWQQDALREWVAQGRRGIVSVVTGGGKTVFALACIADLRPETSLIIVPTLALLDQWWDEAAAFFDLELDEVNIIKGRGGLKSGTINLAVLNSAARLVDHPRTRPCMLVVDECHKAASPKFRMALEVPKVASLGLSATPERQYDDGLQEVLEPALGPVVYEYSYSDALRDGVIVPFELRNVVFDLEDERQADYDKLTRSIARCVDKEGPESEKAIALMLKRARVLNLSLNRVKLALRIVASHRDSQILVFHEDIDACDVIHEVLREHGVASGVYHSRMALRERADVLLRYRRSEIRVLVTCRALDEGFNVPETEVGIIAASTATRRQRIQRLGRVLRPAGGKSEAVIYSLVATKPEVDRLRAEEAELEGVASVSWSRA